jgi:hypothetical protein
VNIVIHRYTDELKTEKQLILVVNRNFEEAILQSNQIIPFKRGGRTVGKSISDLFQHGVVVAAEDESIQT